MLDPRRLALQGLKVQLTPIAMAVQGLIGEILDGTWPAKVPDSAGSWAKKRKAKPQRRRLLDDDDAVVMAIVAAVTSGHLTGMGSAA